MIDSSVDVKKPYIKFIHQPDNYLFDPQDKLQVFLVGMMGAGKTYWASILKKKLKLPAYDLDFIIEMKYGRTIAEIFEKNGPGFFRISEKKVLRLFAPKQNFILSCGGGTPCFHGNMEWMNKQGITIWIDEPVEVLAERLIHSSNVRPLIKDMNKEQLMDYLTSLLEERKPFYAAAQFRLSAPINIDSFKQIFSDYA